MRPYRLVSIALVALAACSGHAQNDASPAPDATPAPLSACEVRELRLDGAQLVVQSNLDGSAASIVVVRAPNDDVRTKAFQDAVKFFGEPHPDTRTQLRQYKWGLTQMTDMCGRPVIGSPSPSPSPT
ncbi:MAG: hypothetical protein KGN02_08500 [bacterium]|nr:hypothetical protein [bacterium]